MTSCRVVHKLSLVIVAGAVIIGYLILATPSPLAFLTDPDQGFQLVNAQKVLLGQHPFINFNTGVYGPLIPYISALGQWLSDCRLIGEITVTITGYSVGYGILFYLTWRLTGSWAASFIALGFMLLLLPRFYKYYIVLGPALFLLALYHFQGTGRRRVLWLAAATVVMGLYRFDFGAYGVLVGSLAVLTSRSDLSEKKYGQELTAFLTIGVAFTGCWLLFVALHAPLQETLRLTFAIVSGAATGLTLPLPAFDTDQGWSRNNALCLAFLLSLCMPVILLLYWLRWRSLLRSPVKQFIPLAAVFAGLVFVQATHRTDIPHVLQVLPVQIPLIAWLGSQVWRMTQWQQPVRWVPPIVILSAAVAVVLPMSPVTAEGLSLTRFRDWVANLDIYSLNRDSLRLYYAQFLEGTDDAWRIQVIQFVYDHTQATEAVAFLPYMPQGYYFAERDYATPTVHYYPGMPNSPEVQAEYIRSFQKRGVNVVVDIPGWRYDDDPQRDIRYYFPALMRYIEQHYPFCKKVGPAVIYTSFPL